MSLIPVLILFGIRCLHTHTAIVTFTSLINISILLSEYHTTQTTTIFKAEQHAAAEAYCGLSAVQCQHRVAGMAYPPYLEQREKGATTDTKLVLNFGERQAAATVLPLFLQATGENTQLQRIVIMEFKDYYSLFIRDILHFGTRFVLLIRRLAEAVHAQTAVFKH